MKIVVSDNIDELMAWMSFHCIEVSNIQSFNNGANE